MSSNVTLKQIANELGVSVMTVSRVVNNKSNVDEKTRKRVMEKAISMGYTPNHVAKSLVSQKTYTIGVVLPEIHHIFFSEVVSGIEEVVYNMNYQLFLINSAENYEREKKGIDALRAKRVDGILISCSENSDDVDYYKRVIDSGLPFVFFDRCVENIGASCVSVNDHGSSKMITAHLARLGRKKIAHLSGPEKISVGQQRREGYLKALHEYNLESRESWIEESGFREEGGYNAMKRLLKQDGDNRPDAVVAVNDPVAFGAMKAIREAGLKIPDDIAIVGFSDDIRSELMPEPLTTVRQPAYTLGKKAAEKLIRTIENEDEPKENIELITEVVVRKSCGAR